MRLLLLATIAATVLEIGRGAHAQVGSPQPKWVIAAPTGPVIDPGWQASVFGWLASRKSYPEEARRRGEEGRVAVRFTVDRSGRVVEAAIVSASGSTLLDEATLGLLRQAVLPPFPADMTQARITITTTLRYSLLDTPAMAQGPYSPSSFHGPIDVVIDTHVLAGPSPTVFGTANLPDGTLLWVTIVPPYPACFPHCGLSVATPKNGTSEGYDDIGRTDVYGGKAVVVKQGRFVAGPEWRSGCTKPDIQEHPDNQALCGFRSTNLETELLIPGQYILEVGFVSAERQPVAVRKIIGFHGENLRGPLVNTCCFGYGLPGSHVTKEDAKKGLETTKLNAAFFGAGLYYARYFEVR